MKNMIISAFSLLAAAMLAMGLPTDAEARIYEDTLRLHILASSDSEEDQALKLSVRDRILADFGEELSCAQDMEDAKHTVESLLPKIEECAMEELSSHGCDKSVRASVGTEWYDTRVYEDFTLPAGYYASLRVVIGEGEGKNWWCVMYPPLCAELATERAPADDGVIDYSREELALIEGRGYNVNFKLLEIVSRAFCKKG